MKYLFVLAIVMSAITSCSKKSIDSSGSPKLEGKWRYTSSYMGTGGPTVTTEASPANQWMELETDGDFKSNIPVLSKFNQFEITDSMHIRFKLAGFNPEKADYYFAIDRSKGTLVLGQLEPRCIEGCGMNFKRW